MKQKFKPVKVKCPHCGSNKYVKIHTNTTQASCRILFLCRKCKNLYTVKYYPVCNLTTHVGTASNIKSLVEKQAFATLNLLRRLNKRELNKIKIKCTICDNQLNYCTPSVYQGAGIVIVSGICFKCNSAVDSVCVAGSIEPPTKDWKKHLASFLRLSIKELEQSLNRRTNKNEQSSS